MSVEENAVLGVVGNIEGIVTTGAFIVNDYLLEVTEVLNGYKLTITKGSETQEIFFKSLTDLEIETIRLAEEERIEHELARIAAETLRTSAEATRVANEEARVSAEAIRVDNEQDRVDEEYTRQTEEALRASAEGDRVNAELVRVADEQERVSAEQGRVTAEQSRVAAETQRGVALAAHIADKENPHEVTASQTGSVSYAENQNLDDDEQEQARKNIGAKEDVYYGAVKKVEDYVYDIYYDELDYQFAYNYFENNNAFVPTGGCSSVRNGNLVGRNFDWAYDNNAEFRVFTNAQDGRYATRGIGGSIPGLTMDFVDSGEKSDLYKLIPFYMQDGVNEYGLVVSTNVVPLDYGTNVSVPTGTLIDTVNGIMLVRYMLDRFKTAYEAVTFVKEHVSVWFSDHLHDSGYEQHYMVSDATSTYALEFVNNQAVVIDISEHPYMTNFYLYNIRRNADGGVYTPETLSTGDPVGDNLITEHGIGLERYNQIVSAYAGANTKSGMRNMLNALMYTKAYSTSSSPSDPYWYTEFVGGDIHCNSDISAFSEAVSKAGAQYSIRSRNDPADKQTWQTTHSVVYDIATRAFSAVFQENGVEISVSMSSDTERIGKLETQMAAAYAEIERLDTDKAPLVHRHTLDEMPLGVL